MVYFGAAGLIRRGRKGMSRALKFRGLATVVLGGLVLALTGCAHRRINQIFADPQRYANHDVGVTGNVVKSVSLLGKGAYQVDDGSGRLWVIATTNRGVPREGARVGVRGRIRDGFNLGGIIKLPEIVRSGMVMIESDHRAK